MIINTGQRTDIPAFYTKWFMNRIREGMAAVRNPFYPQLVTRYRLDPETVDILAFCSKNPGPMLPYIGELKKFRLYWHVTITPYGREIEPNVPEARDVIRDFRTLSDMIGPERVVWRYDPIFISEKYSVGFHKEAFHRIAEALSGSTHDAVISFIDLYEKTRTNFPEARRVKREERTGLEKSFLKSASDCGMRIHSCCEGTEPEANGIDTSGCMTREVLEKAIGEEIRVPAGKSFPRAGCRCLLGADIGAYNSCPHGCRYCYANADGAAVAENIKKHDPDSLLLIGHLHAEDVVRMAEQKSWLTGQLVLKL